MKKRRTLIIALLLIAALALGIGYANLTSTLLIDGAARANPNQDNMSVVFTGDVTTTDSKLATGSINTTKKTEASIDAVGFTLAGETATVTYTIKNEGKYIADVASEVTEPKHSDNEEYFHITTQIGKATLNPNEETTVTVTVTLKNTPIEMKDATIKVTITATAKVTPAATAAT